MRTFAFVAALALAISAPASQALTAQPVIVELYTAQGCSACAAANGLAAKLAARKGIVPLTFPVDYWDYLGWTDTYAQPEFSERQRVHMKRLALREVYTPQVVVDGRAQAAGGQPAKVESLIQAALKAPRKGPRLGFVGRGFVRVEAGVAPRGGGEVWLVRYQPRPERVKVTAGENSGKTVAYANVVKDMVRLGSWSGKRRTFAIPASDDPKLKTVVLLQATRTGAVLGVLQR